MHIRTLLAVAGLAFASAIALASPSLAKVDASPAATMPLDCADQVGVAAPSAVFVVSADLTQCDRELLEATGLCLAPVPQARVAFAFVPPEISTPPLRHCPSGRSPFG